MNDYNHHWDLKYKSAFLKQTQIEFLCVIVQVFQNESINREPSHKGRPIGMSRTADENTDEML